MQTAILLVLIAAVLSFFIPGLAERIGRLWDRRPALLWSLPVLLTAVFSAAALVVGAWSLALAIRVLLYTAGPVLCMYLQRGAEFKRPGWLDLVTILLLWLPLEFATGYRLVPAPARGYLHSVAYGITILLGLLLFLCLRKVPGMKYNFPRRPADWWLPLAGFAAVAPVLILLGIAIGFIPPPHLPTKSAANMTGAAGIILIGTALPEEILFRSLIQNLLMQRFGTGLRTLFVASFIFGCAHLDNGPQPVPNWRYMILATIAGVAYGFIFQRSSTVLASAALHAAVDWTKHFFF